MRFGVLGSLDVWAGDGRPVRLTERKVKVLLADLLVHAGEPVPDTRLVDDLWGENLPGNPVGALRGKVSQLRRVLGQAEPGGRTLVEHGPAGYLVRVDPDDVDAGRFQRLVGRAHQTADARVRAAMIAESLDLWRGPAYADFADLLFVRPTVARLEELRLTALEDYADARLELGDHSLLVGELADLVSDHPLRERLRAGLMRALYRSGRQAEAMATYRDLRARLRDELGLDPSPALVALHHAILQQDPQLDPTPVPPRRSTRARSNLPATVTDLIGRDDLIAQVISLVRAERLVTLTGPGGVGKTRLALETATELAGDFRDGVWLVDLAGGGRGAGLDTQASTEEVAEAVAKVVGVRDISVAGAPAGAGGDLVAGFTRAFGDAEMLIVLDNCEHVVAGTAALAEQLISSAARVRVLATSQRALDIRGEHLVVVPPLGLPEPSEADPDALRRSGAVTLFLTRAAAAAPGFRLDEQNAPAVAAICRRLDGIPLALELAATRLRSLGVHGLAARLDDRFRVLSSGPRDAPPRQRSLQAMIDWSWELLPEHERAVLSRLSVPADGCTLHAAEAVCAGGEVASPDVMGILARLVDRSLVTVVEAETGTRYRLLESVAAYGADRLEEAGGAKAVADRHGRYYTDLAERLAARLYGAEQRRSLQRLDAEAANLRRALAHALHQGDAERALRLVDAVAWYWYLRGRLREAERALTAALELGEMAGAAAVLRARVAVWRAGMRLAMNASPDPVRLVRTVLEPYQRMDQPADQARAQWFLASILFTTGELVLSQELADRSVRTYRALGDEWGLAAALSCRTWAAVIRGDLTAMERDAHQSLELFRKLGDLWGQVEAGEPVAVLAEISGDYVRSARLHRDGLRTAENLGLWTLVSWKLSSLARVTWLTGDHGLANELYERALRLSREQSDAFGELYAELGLGLCARRAGDLAAAESHLLTVRDGGRLLAAGTLLAQLHVEFGHIAELRGDADGAVAQQLQAVAAARASKDPRTIALALEGLAAAQALAGHHAHAAQLLGAAAAARDSAGAPLPAAERGDIDRASRTVRHAVGDETFTTEWKRGRVLTTVHLLQDPSLPGAN